MIDVIGSKNRIDAMQVKLFKNNSFYALMDDYSGYSGGAKYLDHALQVYKVPVDVRDGLDYYYQTGL